MNPGLPNLGWIDSGVTEDITRGPEITVILLGEAFLYVEVTEGKADAWAVFDQSVVPPWGGTMRMTAEHVVRLTNTGKRWEGYTQ